MFSPRPVGRAQRPFPRAARLTVTGPDAQTCAKNTEKRAHRGLWAAQARSVPHRPAHARHAPPLTTAKVKLRLQATLGFHVFEPPLLLLHARSNSHDMSALASQVRHTRQQHSTAAATVALHVYAGGASARAGRARAATAAARAHAHAPAHPSPRGWARRARTRRAVATPSTRPWSCPRAACFTTGQSTTPAK